MGQGGWSLWLCNVLLTVSLQMLVPRSLDELAASLEWEEEMAADWTSGVRGRVASSSAPWARAFLAMPRMREAGREGLFLYMLCCAGERM